MSEKENESVGIEFPVDFDKVSDGQAPKAEYLTPGWYLMRVDRLGKVPGKENVPPKFVINFTIMDCPAVEGADAVKGLGFADFIPMTSEMQWKVKRWSTQTAGRAPSGNKILPDLYVNKTVLVEINDYKNPTTGKVYSQTNNFGPATEWDKRKGKPLADVEIDVGDASTNQATPAATEPAAPGDIDIEI